MPPSTHHHAIEEEYVPPPAVGTFIDDGHLQLISILGEGGFSTVFLARATCPGSCSLQAPTFYAVKFLQSPGYETTVHPRQRQIHLKEATLHSLCSTHPSVAPLHKIVFYHTYTCLVMDYYPEGDLFSAILTHSAYLAQPSLIKDVFLQILDAVSYCHEKQVYLRDLKPENVLVANERSKVYLTDFGLATTDEESSEFKTGSVYHMSPECMGPQPYSPKQNDIWSLGILLLNLVTSRNPWRSANSSDATFTAYLEYLMQSSSSPSSSSVSVSSPLLQRILPISSKLNELLERVLVLDPAKRISVQQMRKEIEDFGEDLDEWYSPDVVFENGCARCQWEIDAEVDENGAYIGERTNTNGSFAESNEGDTEIDLSLEDSSPPRATSSPRSAWSADSFSFSPSSGQPAPVEPTLDQHSHPFQPPQTPVKQLPRRPGHFRISTSPSNSSGSLSLPKTPRDLAQFGSLKVFEEDPSPSLPAIHFNFQEPWTTSVKPILMNPSLDDLDDESGDDRFAPSPPPISMSPQPYFPKRLLGRAVNTLFHRA